MTSIQVWNLFIAGFCSAGALSLAGILLFHNRSSELHRAVSAMVVLATSISVAGNVALKGGDSHYWWGQGLILGELLQVLALFYLVRVFMSQTDATRSRRATRNFRTAVIVCVLAVGCLLVLAVSAVFRRFDAWLIDLGFKGLYLAILLGLILGLAKLEEIFRGLRDPVRYQAKFVLIGIGGLAALEVYQASELFLLSSIRLTDLIARNLGVGLCVGLIGLGFSRAKLQSFTGKVYLSPQVLSGSVSTILIGLYLITVGAVAQWINTQGGDIGAALSIALVFWALLALVIAVASRSVRARLRLFLARHFYRSKYDYREKWLEVTNTFEQADSTDAILDRLRDLLGRTFSAARIAVWMRYEADQRFHEVRSVNTVATASPKELTDPLVARLLLTHDPVSLSSDRPVSVPASPATAMETLTRADLGIPIRAGEELMAFVVMSKEVSGEEYQPDDVDLLRAMASHVGLLLANAKLAEERTAAAELEALHRFSAFCLHDLKNLAARLSLVLQNAEVHGDNPEFQKSALKTVAGTVAKITGLITKLSIPQVQSYGQDLTDVNELVRAALAGLNGQVPMPLLSALGAVPPVRVNRDQIQSVLLNLVLNARQAVGDDTAVQIITMTQAGKAVITVCDSGRGISPEQLRRLFQPFQTTKAEGMGIGLYQCKQIIETHGGTIRINSQVGEGTTVRIELPAAQCGQ